ncbi:unnamed protein product [Gadus morhua 'NCC']
MAFRHTHRRFSANTVRPVAGVVRDVYLCIQVRWFAVPGFHPLDVEEKELEIGRFLLTEAVLEEVSLRGLLELSLRDSLELGQLRWCTFPLHRNIS